MKPVKQDVFEDYKGNCFSASIASILEVPLETVPNFCAMQSSLECANMFEAANLWLIKNHNKKLKYFNITEYSVILPDFERYVILCGKSPRPSSDGSTKHHAVVAMDAMVDNPYQIYASGHKFKVVHDPHPDNTTIVGEPYAVIFILPL